MYTSNCVCKVGALHTETFSQLYTMHQAVNTQHQRWGATDTDHKEECPSPCFWVREWSDGHWSINSVWYLAFVLHCCRQHIRFVSSGIRDMTDDTAGALRGHPVIKLTGHVSQSCTWYLFSSLSKRSWGVQVVPLWKAERRTMGRSYFLTNA